MLIDTKKVIPVALTVGFVGLVLFMLFGGSRISCKENPFDSDKRTLEIETNIR